MAGVPVKAAGVPAAIDLASSNSSSKEAPTGDYAVTPYEKRLEERVLVLERLVEEQWAQIGALQRLVDARDASAVPQLDEGLDARLQDVEAAINLVKRNHEALQLDLIKKNVL